MTGSHWTAPLTGFGAAAILFAAAAAFQPQQVAAQDLTLVPARVAEEFAFLHGASWYTSRPGAPGRNPGSWESTRWTSARS